MEVARRLAELPGLPLSPPPGTDHRPGAGDGTALTGCTFLQDPAPPRGPCPPVAGGAKSPSVSPLQSTEEADSETESEADDASALEKARQVQLPFSVDWVVNLSKSDFQQLLKRQTLNLEQQEFVHDMRRRSKNRMAARRCRKRKLDCIHNLECEIIKLRTEKQRMMAEQSRLQQLKTRSWSSVSALCDKICSEASLMPEQLQVLAKYTTSDCPFASFIPHMDIALSGPAATPQAQASLEACSSDPGVDAACALRSSHRSGDVFSGTERPLEDAAGP